MDRREMAWQEFRTAREAELVQSYGWLTLRGFHWLPPEPAALPDLPGLWSTDGQDAHVEADGGLLVDGRPLRGRSTKTVAETGRVPWLQTEDGVEIELLRRGGRLAIRMRAETSAEREAFRGVPVWDHDPAWVITARFHPTPERRVDVDTHRPDLRQNLPAPGEVEFTIDGQPQRLVATNIKTGLSIEFHDPTNGDETPAWRQLKFADPDEHGQVVLDFNRTINMWFAFTDHATCPAPFAGNTITVPVRAGEKRPPD